MRFLAGPQVFKGNPTVRCATMTGQHDYGADATRTSRYY